MSQPADSTTPAQKKIDIDAYWKENVRLISILLVIWFAVSYLPVIIVNQLNQLKILTGFPFGYYMGGQGSLIVFVVLIFYYAYQMEKLERKYGFEDF